MPVNFLNTERHLSNFRKGIVRDQFDEPTYLTFSLDFTFDDMYRNDDFLAISPLFNVAEGKSQSAINYLIQRGHTDKANQLSIFSKLLKYLRDDTPWYFQEVVGLNALWQKATNMAEPMKGGEITVKTLEAVDLRMTELADLYRNAVYDKQYMRERVPDNLRWFSMDIWVAEFRNLRNVLPSLVNLGAGINIGGPNLAGALGAGNNLGNVLDNFGYVKMKCRQCEFDFSDSFPGGPSMSIGGNKQPEANQFKIKIGWMEEENHYSSGSATYDDATSAKTRGSNTWDKAGLGANLDSLGGFLTGLPIIGNKASTIGGKASEGISSVLNTPNKLISQGISELSQLVDQGNLGITNVVGYESQEGRTAPRNTAVPKKPL
jgi:hypothetical protein